MFGTQNIQYVSWEESSVKASGISLLKYNISKILLVRSIFTIHFLVIEYFAKRNFCSDNHIKMIINFKQEIFWQPKSFCVIKNVQICSIYFDRIIICSKLWTPKNPPLL